MDQRSGDGRFNKFAGKKFQIFEMLDARIASALNKIIQNFHFKKKVSLGTDRPERGPVFVGKTNRLHDL